MKSKIITLFTVLLGLSCTESWAQQIEPHQIISLYSELTNGQTFYLKDTRNGTNGGEWSVPKGKTFMLTDISAIFDAPADGPTNALILGARLLISPVGTTNTMTASCFNIGYGAACNVAFITPIPIGPRDTISHNLSGTGEVILRGYLTGLP